MAFLPQFLDPAQHFWTQMLVFEATFLVLAFANANANANANACGWGLVAARTGRVVSSPRAIRALNRTGGGILVGAGGVDGEPGSLTGPTGSA